ncbi:MAG: hypothetical protein ACTSWK_17705 [Promethearchaeota archaeon]
MNRLNFLLDKAKRRFFQQFGHDDSFTFEEMVETWEEEGCKTDWLEEPERTELKFLYIVTTSL